MQKSKFKIVTDKLIKEKEKILGQIEIFKKSDPFSDPDHTIDNASVDTDVREQEAHQRIEAETNSLKKRLEDINQALLRVEKGLYGVCKRCNKSILEKRLELIPEASYCVSCEEDLKS